MPTPAGSRHERDLVPVDWAEAIRSTIADDAFTVVTQPIVDLARGTVVGYEALARFERLSAPPDEWFAAAQRLGRGVDLACLVLQRQLALREHLPPNCFLTVNVSPGHLGLAPVQRLLSSTELGGLVIELTEHDQFEDPTALRTLLTELRERGAMIALDDAGTGYAGLQTILELQPDLVKLDRSLIEGLHNDPAKLALVETMGTLLSRMDAWVLAEGIETAAELDAVLHLQVPLGQGYVFGRPGPGWPRPDPALLADVAGRHLRMTVSSEVISVMEAVHLVRTHSGFVVTGTDDGPPTWVVVVDARDRPLIVCHPDDPRIRREVRDIGLQTVKSTERVTDVVDRAMTRPSEHRYHPVVCTDPDGRVVGIARMERLIREVVHQARRTP